MAVRLSAELIFAKVASGLGSEFSFCDDKIMLQSPESEKVCRHEHGWFKKTKIENRLKRIIARFDWSTSNDTYTFKIFGKDQMSWGEKFAGTLSSALGKDVTLHLTDEMYYTNCRDADHYSSWL